MTISIEEFQQALQSLNRLEVQQILKRALIDRSPLQCIENLVLPTMMQIGTGWEQGTITLSQVYMSGRICEDLVDTILPPADPKRKDQPTMAIATLDDYHMLGKRIVYSVLRSSGFELLDYGRRTMDALAGSVQDDGIEILLVSVLMLPSALRVRDLKTKLDQRNVNLKLGVGGAPFRFDENLWVEVGADAMGRNASDAVEIIAQMTGGQS